MKYIKDTNVTNLIINKSKFITTIFRVNSIEEINNYLALTKKKYYDANHNCYAYALGINQEIQKCSDDGEPQKTAGSPILDVIKKSNVTNVLIIVTRYFGGVLLGSGGLIRAYSKSASNALENLNYYELQSLTEITLTLTYKDHNNIVTFLNDYNILDSSFNQNVILKMGILKTKVPDFIKKINDLTNAKALIIVGQEYQVETLISNI